MDLTVVASFVGTLLALALQKTVERFVVRRLEAADLARDALVDLLSGLTGVENALETLLAAKMPQAALDLAETPSGWDLSTPAIKLDRMLGTFDDEQVHRLAILYYERYEHFARRSKQHEDAYYWLLDHPELDWSRPQAAERVGRMLVARKEMTTDARDMMRFGYELAAALWGRTKAPGLPMITRPSLPSFLAERFGLDEEGIRVRKAFYSLCYLPFVFDSRIEYTLVVWRDALATELHGVRGVLALDVQYKNGEGVPTEGTVMVPPLVEVALPASAVVRSGWIGWGRTSQSLHPFEFRVEALPHDGSGRGRLTLPPKELEAAMRLLKGSALAGLPGR
ncbi:hypothetical protein [Polyangium aurulentum]|uniref:hypothetical protein n=1 Tax=Polyangium aurulentum TaxID=2567896 RepID=UPI0010ADF2D7|nr:hypothetical protein [Polyangium aurulentum]UQA57045.1 hypothetical protein E8A73_038000 [Polyangium aurulentum]